MEHTFAVEKDESDDHEHGMVVELLFGRLGPAEAAAIAAHPYRY
jgi:hypothetical protein